MSAREAHAKALAGELVLVDIRTTDEWRKTGVPASGYAITMVSA
jgi:rhodanese-related sulfurtransferase